MHNQWIEIFHLVLAPFFPQNNLKSSRNLNWTTDNLAHLLADSLGLAGTVSSFQRLSQGADITASILAPLASRI